MEPSGGWYNTRRQYRSVAFGTWKVGGARHITTRNESSDPYLRKKRVHPGLDRNSRRMGESSPNLARIHPTVTVKSLSGLPNSVSVDNRLADPRLNVHDCYSSTEYVQYSGNRQNEDCGNGNQVSEPVQAVFRADQNLNYSVSTKRKSRLESSLQRAHHRSHSAGADAQYSIHNSTSCVSSTSSEMKNPLALLRETRDGNTKFLRATKKFFKKIYDTATLPNKKQDVAKEKVDNRFDAISSDDEEENTSRIDDYRILPNGFGKNSFIDASFPDIELDRSSTPDQSLESMTMTSKSDSSSMSRHEQIPFDDLFAHLRREMNQMRLRDAQILADLHRVETQIQNVKRAQRGSFVPVDSQEL